MISIDRNDVDISKLFRWGGKFTVEDIYNKRTLDVYIRLVGDADINRARVYALRESAKLRKLLRTEGSDERVAYIPDKEVLDEENIIAYLVLYNTRNVTTDALSKVRYNIPKEPDSDASLEEQEKYQKEIDEFPQKREEQIRKYVDEKVEDVKRFYSDLEFDKLYKEYEKETINQICEELMVRKFKEMCVYLGSYKDPDFKESFFEEFEQFDNLPSDIKTQFTDFYLDLEIGGENLKNLLGATQ